MTATLTPGAVALFDALGFKGIWRRFPAAAIVNTLTALKVGAQNAATKADLFAHAFSDTIAIGAMPKPGFTDATLGMHNVLDAIVDVVDQLVHLGLASHPPLAFRGTIAVGDLIATPDVLVGAAVDEAAALYEQAHAAIIWFAPGALDHWVTWNGSRVPTLMSNVPLRSGGSCAARAINPLARFVSAQGGHPAAVPAYADFRRQTDHAFKAHSQGPLSPAVALKLANTIAFLDSCEAALGHLCDQEMAMIAAALEGTRA
jgi:hypothetical protein